MQNENYSIPEERVPITDDYMFGYVMRQPGVCAKVISSELKALLDYFRNPNKLPENEETDLVRELDRFVDYANRDTDWRQGYMTYMQAQMDARTEGRLEGRLEGRREGRLEGRREGRREGRLEGRREGRREGRLEGILEGQRQGEDKQARETAIIMSQSGFDPEIIAKVTQRPENVVLEWIKG